MICRQLVVTRLVAPAVGLAAPEAMRIRLRTVGWRMGGKDHRPRMGVLPGASKPPGHGAAWTIDRLAAPASPPALIPDATRHRLMNMTDRPSECVFGSARCR